MTRDRQRLSHIIEAIERIEKYAVCGEDRFRQDELVQNWMIHHLQVIGEAARGLSDESRDSHPTVPWSSIIGMRHILVHDYFGIDLKIVWRTIRDEVPDLKDRIQCMLAEDD